jgi:hypothetical protein
MYSSGFFDTGGTLSEICCPTAVKNSLKLLAISTGSDISILSLQILSIDSDFLLFPKISFKVSHVFLGFFAFASSLEVKYNFLAARMTRWYTA